MLFWKVVIDGDGVGDGEVACDAGATTSSIATTEAKTAPIILSNPPGRLCGKPLGVLLKFKSSTWVGWPGVRHCNRCKRHGTDGGVSTGWGPDCDIRHRVWFMLQLVRGKF